MSIKPSGPLSFTEIAAEFGATKPLSLSKFYRGGALVPNSPNNQKIATGGSISFGQFYGAAKTYVLDIRGPLENISLYDLFVLNYGDPAGKPVNVLGDIQPGCVIGGVSSFALLYGQFPSGSIITVDNRGSIQGQAGGSAFVGGNAVLGNYPNQKMIFNNYGEVYAGGGGGGLGGYGGQGGTGQISTPTQKGQGNLIDRDGPGQPACPKDDKVCGCSKFGANAYCSYADACKYGVAFCSACIACAVDVITPTTGGAGGPGGAGGRGRGYNVLREDGQTGGGGAAGGANAGVGGQGGTGGGGGDWGQPGVAGNTGHTGGNGNTGAGQPGLGGGGPGGGGNYLVKQSADFTFNNQGRIAGGVA